jgi:hypothetical protein
MRPNNAEATIVRDTHGASLSMVHSPYLPRNCDALVCWNNLVVGVSGVATVSVSVVRAEDDAHSPVIPVVAVKNVTATCLPLSGFGLVVPVWTPLCARVTVTSVAVGAPRHHPHLLALLHEHLSGLQRVVLPSVLKLHMTWRSSLA